MQYPIVQSTLTPELEKVICKFFAEYAISQTGIEGLSDPPISFEIRKEDGSLIACLAVQLFWGQLYIEYLFVEEAYRQQGYGTQLMEHAIEFGRKQGCDFIFLQSMSFQAPNFYKKLGFQVDFVRHGYTKGVSYYYLTKYLAQVSNTKIEIRPLTQMDIATIVTGFANANWSKSASMFEIYWQQQQAGSMQVWVAHLNQQFAGYIILNWKSDYKPFYSQGIPEIMDLNILPSFRKQGVGSKLLDTAEAMVAIKTNQVGLGIKLYAEYGPVQRLYVRRGYIPDGRGVTYHYQHIAPGSNVSLDDDLVLWFVKRLS